MCWRTVLSWKERPEGIQFGCWKDSRLPDPAWIAGFVSKSNSYSLSPTLEDTGHRRPVAGRRILSQGAHITSPLLDRRLAKSDSLKSRDSTHQRDVILLT